MKPKLACADFTFPLLPHAKALDLIAMLGIKGVDIGLFEDRSHLWPSREFKRLRPSARQLEKKLRDRGLVAADIFLQMGEDFAECALNHPQARQRRSARDGFSKTLEYAAECGAKHVTSLPGVLFAEETRASSWSRAVDELAEHHRRADEPQAAREGRRAGAEQSGEGEHQRAERMHR